jgi:hypothetical protein
MRPNIHLDNIDLFTNQNLRSLHASALGIVKASLRLLDKHYFARAESIAGEQDVTPSLSDLAYEDLHLIEFNFSRLVGRLRQLHEHVFPHDPIFSEEIRLACSGAILGRSDTNFARRRWMRAANGTSTVALVSQPRSALLQIEAVLDKVGRTSKTPSQSIKPPEMAKSTESRREESSVEVSQVTRKKEQNERAAMSSVDKHTQKLVSCERAPHYPPGTGYVEAACLLEQTPQQHSGESRSRSKGVNISKAPILSASDKHKMTLEERLAALRTATAVTASLREPVNTTISDSLTKVPHSEEHLLNIPTALEVERPLASNRPKDSPILQPDSLGEQNDESAGGEKHARNQKGMDISRRIKTVDVVWGTYIKELSKHKCSKVNTSETHDIIEFTVIGPNNRPVSQSTWHSKVPKGFEKRKESSKGLIRQHVAEKLNADPRSLGLFYGNNSLGESTIKAKMQVRIMLDPYIRFTFGTQTLVSDFARKNFNKCDLTVGELRAKARAMIAEKQQHSIHLFINSQPLQHDSVRLRDTGLLSARVLAGWEPLVILTTVEIEAKECVVCGDELPFGKFPLRIASTCDHEEINTCRKCLRTWIKTTLSSKGFDKINCPECHVVLQYADVKAWAGKRTFER